MIDAAAILAGQASGGPPSDVGPNELVRKLLDTAPPNERLPFPRLDDDGKPLFEYRMRVLSQSDIDSARANAEAYTRRKLKETRSDEQLREVRREAWSEIYEDAKCAEVLFLACRQPDDVSKPLFMSPNDIRKAITADEAAALFSAYTTVQARFGPLFRVLSEDEIEAWIERLTAGCADFPFLHLAPGMLVQLTVSLAYRLRALRTGTGSSGLPVSDSPSESSGSPE